jgi:nitrogen PTS system EIIA component
MADVDEFLSPDRMLLGLRSGSKRQLFQELAAVAAEATGLDPTVILAALTQREKLGTTGIGEGIAIPHARVKDLAGLIGFFARLAAPVEYDALDDAPVDLVFLLLAPDEASTVQLKALARIARLLREPEIGARLRNEQEPDLVYALLTGRAPPPPTGGGSGAMERS